MVALEEPEIRAIPIEAAISKIKHVPVHSDLVETARDMGISFGD